MTLIEFLHPLRRESRTIQVQAALYYIKHYLGRDSAQVAEIRDALIEARMPGAKGTNLGQALARGTPNVRPVARGVWEITGTGERNLREMLGLGPLAPQDQGDDVAPLIGVVAKVPDAVTRDYVKEAVECLRAGARRASVVFLWTGAVATIREEVWRFGARSIEAGLKIHNPRAKFRKKGDFEGVKDADLLQIAHDMAIHDKSQKKRLSEALDLRNDCGHPAKYMPGKNTVASFVEDIVGIVWP